MSATSASLSDYRSVLSTPGARIPIVMSALGRLPITMLGLATLLYVRQATGSFAVAGLVSAGILIGVSLGSVGQGRVIDRLGATRPLLLASVAFAASAAAVVWAVETHRPIGVLVALALLTGLSEPALQGTSRALWTKLLPPGSQREAAFGYEAISFEVFFILGPALAAFLYATPWPGTGFAVAAGAMTIGAAGFAVAPVVRQQELAPVGPSVGMLGALARPGMRTVALASLGFGLVVGCVEVGVPAVATAMGEPTLGGVLLSAWSVVSVAVGVVYAARPWPRPMHLRLPVLLGVFALCVAAMALGGPTGSLTVLVVTMLAAGALLTPQVTAHSLAVEIAAPPGAATEGFGWVITAATLGIGIGQPLAGLAVESSGPSAAFLAGGCAGLVLAAALWLRRGSLRPGPDRSEVASGAVPVPAPTRS